MTHSTAMPATFRSGADSLTERAIRVIEAVVDAGEAVGPRGLARSLGIDRSTVGRILQQLTELDMFERRDDGYIPGPRLFSLGRVLGALDTLPGVIGPLLEDLVRRFDETCYVCAFHGDVAVFTHEVQSSKPLRFVVELGRPVPLHAGAAGRAILAGLGPDTGLAILGNEPLPQLTPNTIVDRSALIEAISTDVARGYTVSREERVQGGAAIAAPFFTRQDICQGSIVFTTPLSRLDDDQIDTIGSAVAAAARDLSRHLRGARE